MSEDVLTELVGQGKFDMFEWAWGVEPDPNYMLSTLTCANRSYVQDRVVYANLSDSFYCKPAYDVLFAAQGIETDNAKRELLVKQMQQLLYGDAPYVITYYSDIYEAYRSDRFEGFVPQPEGTGRLLFQWGAWSYESVRPVVTDTGTGTSTDSGAAPVAPTSSTAPIVGGILVLIILLGGGAYLIRRRRPGSALNDDRE